MGPMGRMGPMGGISRDPMMSLLTHGMDDVPFDGRGVRHGGAQYLLCGSSRTGTEVSTAQLVDVPSD